jgi:hypothetical protein
MTIESNFIVSPACVSDSSEIIKAAVASINPSPWKLHPLPYIIPC